MESITRAVDFYTAHYHHHLQMKGTKSVNSLGLPRYSKDRRKSSASRSDRRVVHEKSPLRQSGIETTEGSRASICLSDVCMGDGTRTASFPILRLPDAPQQQAVATPAYASSEGGDSSCLPYQPVSHSLKGRETLLVATPTGPQRLDNEAAMPRQWSSNWGDDSMATLKCSDDNVFEVGECVVRSRLSCIAVCRLPVFGSGAFIEA